MASRGLDLEVQGATSPGRIVTDQPTCSIFEVLMSSTPPGSLREARPGTASSTGRVASRAPTPTTRRPSRRTSPWKRRAAQLGKVSLFIAGAAVIFGLFAVVGLQVALRFREVSVPDLVTRTVDEASATLSDAGLILRIEPLSRIHPTIPASHVAAQDPAAGLTTRRQRSVKVWLSSGVSAGSVPTLIGQSERGARARLQEDALGLARISEIRSSRYPSNAVVAQEPPPLGSATRVSVLINRGERGATYVMPDLIGVLGASAAEMLRAGGFRVAMVGDHLYPGAPPGIILRQFPRAGFQIAHGEAISLEVSR